MIRIDHPCQDLLAVAIQLPQAEIKSQRYQKIGSDEKTSQLSALIMSIGSVHGGFISRDNRAQLKELGITGEQLQLIESKRGRLLGGMQRSSNNSSSSKTTEEDTFDSSSMQVLSIARDKIQFGRLLGKGSYGAVYEGTWSHRKVAVKCYEGTTLPGKVAREIRHEVSIMQKLDHECLVKFFGLVEEENHPAMLVMEQGANGSLFSYLHSDADISWGRRLRMGEDLARGLAYLHEQNIVHRDIKSLNIVLDKNYNAKWCDFGLAQLKLHSTTTSKADTTGGAVGTIRWMAPELFSRGTSTRSKASDIWALGMVYFELASREIPYKDAFTNEEAKDWIKDGEKETVPVECMEQVPGFGALMQRCWALRTDRPTADQIETEMGGLAEQADVDDLGRAAIIATSSVKNTPVASPAAATVFTKTLAQDSGYALFTDVPPAQARAKVVEPKPAPVQVPVAASVSTIPAMAFGKAQWAKYFGDIGVEPPLPSGIAEILNGPCPIWSGQKVSETHLLVLVPETVNGKSFCIDLLDTLVKSPKEGGTSTQINRGSSWADALKEHGPKPASASHWVLLPKRVLPESASKNYQDQVQYVVDLSRRTGATYEVAHLLDAMTGALVECVRTGNRAFEEKVPGRTYDLWGRVQEQTDGYRLVLGAFSASGLCVYTHYHGFALDYNGVLVSRKF